LVISTPSRPPNFKQKKEKRTFFDSVVYGGGECRTTSWAEKEGTRVNIGEKE